MYHPWRFGVCAAAPLHNNTHKSCCNPSCPGSFPLDTLFCMLLTRRAGCLAQCSAMDAAFQIGPTDIPTSLDFYDIRHEVGLLGTPLGFTLTSQQLLRGRAGPPSVVCGKRAP